MIGEVALVLLGVIVAPAALYAAKYWWDRRRWKTFSNLIDRFAEKEMRTDLISRDDMHALVTTKLTDAGYEPEKIKELMEVAVWFATARISYHVLGGRIVGDLDHTEDGGDFTDE